MSRDRADSAARIQCRDPNSGRETQSPHRCGRVNEGRQETAAVDTPNTGGTPERASLAARPIVRVIPMAPTRRGFFSHVLCPDPS